MAEKFSSPELAALRTEVLQGTLDSRQTAELFQVFLMGRGYGVSPQAAWDAATRVGGAGCSIESLQRELERIALVQ
ncbi:MAG: hypothetical protein ACE14L_16310 [Terriglobales bacterium]